MTDIQTYALQNVARALEETVQHYVYNRPLNDGIDTLSWAQELIDTYNDAINSFNQLDGE